MDEHAGVIMKGSVDVARDTVDFYGAVAGEDGGEGANFGISDIDFAIRAIMDMKVEALMVSDGDGVFKIFEKDVGDGRVMAGYIDGELGGGDAGREGDLIMNLGWRELGAGNGDSASELFVEAGEIGIVGGDSDAGLIVGFNSDIAGEVADGDAIDIVGIEVLAVISGMGHSRDGGLGDDLSVYNKFTHRVNPPWVINVQ